jgi:hypothetical protein
MLGVSHANRSHGSQHHTDNGGRPSDFWWMVRHDSQIGQTKIEDEAADHGQCGKDQTGRQAALQRETGGPVSIRSAGEPDQDSAQHGQHRHGPTAKHQRQETAHQTE